MRTCIITTLKADSLPVHPVAALAKGLFRLFSHVINRMENAIVKVTCKGSHVTYARKGIMMFDMRIYLVVKVSALLNPAGHAA